MTPPTPGIGKTIKSTLLSSNEFDIDFTDGTTIRLYDDGQSCCEHRYITTDDDTHSIEGYVLLSITAKDGPTEEDEYEVNETCFVEVQTSGGFITLTNHNDHNGYYGGFCLAVREVGSNE